MGAACGCASAQAAQEPEKKGKEEPKPEPSPGVAKPEPEPEPAAATTGQNDPPAKSEPAEAKPKVTEKEAAPPAEVVAPANADSQAMKDQIQANIKQRADAGSAAPAADECEALKLQIQANIGRRAAEGSNAAEEPAAPAAEVAAAPAPAAEPNKATVWGMPPSANAMGAHLFAQHVLGDDKYEFKQCNIMEGQHHTPEFAAMNPFTAIPIFKDTDGLCMGESTAILLHLEAKYGNKMIDSTCTWALMMRSDKIYNGGWCNIVYPVLGFMPAVTAEVLKAAIESLQKNLATYENTFLKRTTFVGGDVPCVADFAMAPLIFALKHQTIKDATGFVLPERWCTYMDAFIGKVPGAAMLSSAGGYSMGEMLDSKAPVAEEAAAAPAQEAAAPAAEEAAAPAAEEAAPPAEEAAAPAPE